MAYVAQHDDMVYSVSDCFYDPVSDRQLVATASRDNSARLWDVHSGEEVMRLRSSPRSLSPVMSVSSGFELAGGLLCVVTGSFDGVIRVWNVRTGELVRSLVGHRCTVVCVSNAFHGRQGRLEVASCSDDHTVRVWDLESGRNTDVFRLTFGRNHEDHLAHAGCVAVSGVGADAVVAVGTDSVVSFLQPVALAGAAAGIAVGK